MKKCPHCGLISPGTAQHCDCGYDFTKQSRPAVIEKHPVIAYSSTGHSSKPLAILGVLLAIPLVAFLAAVGIQWKLNSVLRDALSKQTPSEAISIAGISITTVCQDSNVRADHDLSEVCSDNDNLERMKSGAILAATIGIVMLGGIWLGGRVARGRRRVLLLLFAPGLHLTMLVMSGLMVLYAALGMATIYYGESILFGRIHVGLMLALGLAALVGVFALISAQLGTVRKARTAVLGKKLEFHEHQRLWDFVEKLADGMSAKRPQAIIAGLEPNFYVTEANVTSLDGNLQGRTMYISLPLSHVLSTEEFKAVLAHELGHYKGLDTRFSERFYPIYRGASQALIGLQSGFSQKGSAGDFILFTAFATLSYFLGCFSDAEKEISRDRELAADCEAAAVAGNRNIASALVKIHAFAPAWQVIRKHMKDVIEQGKIVTNASALFASVVNEISSDEAVGQVSEEGPLHPTDTHPPLSLRLRSLNLGLDEIVADAEATSPSSSPIGLLDNPEELEANLTEIEQAMMIRTGEATPRDEAADGGFAA